MKKCVLAVSIFLFGMLAVCGADGVTSITAIHAVDNQYLKTTYVPTAKTVVEVVVSVDNPAKSGTVFCSRNGQWDNTSYRLYYSGGVGWKFDYKSGAPVADQTGAAVANRKYTIKCSPDGLWIDGTLVAARTVQDFTPVKPFALFASYTGDFAGPNTWANMRFYSMKVWEPDASGELQLQLDLVPCQCADGRIGVYDNVGKTAFADGNSNFPLAPSLQVPSRNGIGDSAALQSALESINKASLNKAAVYFQGAELFLEPGVYDLGDCAMESDSHLKMAACGGAKIVGLGKSPSETVLLGGGESHGKRILHFPGGASANYATISNMTFTGGYTAASGGAVLTSGTVNYDTCVISNNYAAGGGGGVFNGRARNETLFADNRGGASYGGGMREGEAYDCVFSNNTASVGGGCCFVSRAERCAFINNRAGNGGGMSGDVSSCSPVAIKCLFVGNVCGNGNVGGAGGGFYAMQLVSNCTFVANGDSGGAGCYGSVGHLGTMMSCIVTNSLASRRIVSECHVERCYFVDCGKSSSSAVQAFSVCGNYGAGTKSCRVVNSVFERITSLNAVDRLAQYRMLVNCTIRDSIGVSGGMPLDETDTVVNTIVSGCTPYDMVASSLPVLKNCLWTKQDGDIAAASAPGCRKARPRFAESDGWPFGISARSKAFNAGAEDSEILAMVGAVDFAGRPRRLFGRLDIGAMEALSDAVPGLRLIIK